MSDRRWPLPEERKSLTPKQYAELYMRQDGKCGCCGQRLEVKGGREVSIRDEHLNPLWRGGSNDLSNRELWCLPCTKPKDAREATERAKGKRVMRKYIGAPKPKKGRGFRGWTKFDGTPVYAKERI